MQWCKCVRQFLFQRWFHFVILPDQEIDGKNLGEKVVTSDVKIDL